MTDLRRVPCRHCGQANRVPAERLGDGPICGKCKQPLFPGTPIELNGNNFEEVVRRGDLPVVVDFWAPWCGPCKMMAPAFAAAAGALEPHYLLAKLNTDDWPQLAAPFQIAGIPTMVLFRGGREVNRVSGAMDTGNLVKWIRAN